ncbi:N-acetylmuramoyl-L-alanine amidase [Candidatus Nomurabacteria bacterium]|nr:N-acetylmuramoyl-L-alanine amidase [Candidatus Nomurabacteria bacterium]MCB9827855.1 N-acetylmuramoyl-L-alanine amidase [Candidatus Nomurabacteria bacterium]
MRFRAIDIPKFSKVLLARLRLRPAITDETDFTVNLKIKGIKEPDPAPFKPNGSNRPSTRTKTINAVDWDIIRKWNVHEWVQTPNLNLIVEELISQSGWKPGNSLAFVIEDDGSPADQSKTCYDSSKGEGYQAELEIYYLPQGLHEQVTIGLIQGNDRDGEEDYKSTWYPNGFQNNMTTFGDDGSLDPEQSPNDAGFIFSPIAIPKRAEIISAKILVTSPFQNNGMPNVLIKGLAEDDAAVFVSNGSNRPSLRNKTNAKVQWNLGHAEAGVLIGDHWTAESAYESPELKDIIQEIVDRPGWAESKLGLVLENYNSGHGNTKYIWDYNQDSGKYAPRLLIAWTKERRVTARDKDVETFNKANYPEFIIVHHSATPRDNTRFETIKKAHIGFGWDDIGYHKWIAGALDGDGVLILGRPDNVIGAHCDSNKMNYRSLGVVLCGSFHNSETPTSAQLTTLQKVLDDLRQERSIPKERVFGHGEVPESATDCPGNAILPYVQRYRATGSLQ